MIEQDTIRLLRECDAGAAMGISSIDSVLPRVQDKQFYKMLEDCRMQHRHLQKEIRSALDRFHDEGKTPGVMASAMSSFKINLDLMLKPCDSTIASLMTDGCGMGIKSLSEYLNQYKAADESAKDVCRRLIDLEDGLLHDLRCRL